MAVRGMRGLQKKVEKMERELDDNVEKAVRDGAASTASEAKSAVITGGQVWRGHLANSIRAEEVDGPTLFRMRVVADTPYAAMVEFGTGPRSDPRAPPRFKYTAPEHTPRLTAAITEWVRTKPSFVGGFRTEDIGTLGWLIARNISKVGTNPHPYMRPSWFATKPELLRKARVGVKRAVRS